MSGTREVLGHKPGEVFEAHLDGVTESRLYVGGHIERVDEFQFDPGYGQREENVDVIPEA